MQITDLGIEIRDIPNIDFIQVVADPASDRGVNIRVLPAGQQPLDFDLDGLVELVNGLTEAANRARRMVLDIENAAE